MIHTSKNSKAKFIHQDEHGRYIAGIDLSKSTLDVHFCAKSYRFRNNEEGFKDLLTLIKTEQKPVVVAYESTGAISRPFTRKLMDESINWICLQPYMVRSFAKGLGVYAKTDKIDAEMIARYVSIVKPRKEHQIHSKQLEMQEIYGAMELLKRQQASINAAISSYTDADVLAGLKQVVEEMEDKIEKLRARIMDIVRADDELQARYKLYIEQPGIGREIALCLLCHLPELGCFKSRAISALVGVAPYNRESGGVKGKRHIFGGRKVVRDMLFMAGISIRRCKNGGSVKEFYLQQKAAGKSSKELAINCAHKILRILNAKTREMLAALAM